MLKNNFLITLSITAIWCFINASEGPKQGLNPPEFLLTNQFDTTGLTPSVPKLAEPSFLPEENLATIKNGSSSDLDVSKFNLTQEDVVMGQSPPPVFNNELSIPVTIVLIPSSSNAPIPFNQEEHNSSLLENTDWLQWARVDTTNGNTVTGGNNPNGDNGAINFSGAGPQRPSWLNYWVWLVSSNEGYVRYYRINLTGIIGADSIKVWWLIHGTSSGGHSGTRWFVDLNGNRYNHPDTLYSGGWQWWYWRTNLASWNFNSSNNYFKIGLQSTSTTVMAVKRILVYVYGARGITPSWWQWARVDTTNGNTLIGGGNPNGDNGAINFSGAGPQRPSWLNYWVWLVSSNEGYVRYYRINLTGINSVDSILVWWQVHGTSSGGHSGTRWFVDVNGNRYNHPDTLYSGGWQWWYWRTNLASWNFNSSNNYFKIGLQNTSTTVMAVKRIYVGFNMHPPTVGVEERSADRVVNKGFKLGQNNPNPFNNQTLIRYSLPIETEVNLKIINSAGRIVRTLFEGKQKPGNYNVTWNLKGVSQTRLPNGVYFYRLEAGEFTATKKMVKTE